MKYSFVGFCDWLIDFDSRNSGRKSSLDVQSVRSRPRWIHFQVGRERFLRSCTEIFRFREEMEDVVGSVFDLMGRTSDPILEEEVINERVDYIFEVAF